MSVFLILKFERAFYLLARTVFEIVKKLFIFHKICTLTVHYKMAEGLEVNKKWPKALSFMKNPFVIVL